MHRIRRSKSFEHLEWRSPRVPPKARPASLSPPPPHLRRHYIDINIPIPNELWGAASLALKLWSPPSPSTRLASLAAPTAKTDNNDNGNGNAMAMSLSLSEALDYRPRLSLWEEALCMVIATALCATVMVACRSLRLCATLTPRFLLAAVAFWALALAVVRSMALELHFQSLQRSESELAGADAQFFDFENVRLHITRSSAPSPSSSSSAPLPVVHCLHGFGASTYSWSFVQDKLAKHLGGVVTAHDLPGFGLSSRPSKARPYSLAFNGAAAEAILDKESRSQCDGVPDKTKLKVLIGHSMGAAAAAEAIIQRSRLRDQDPQGHQGNTDGPGKNLALVLVAPAIVAMWPGIPAAAVARGDPVSKGMALFEELVGPEDSIAMVSSSSTTRGQSLKNTSTPSTPSSTPTNGIATGRTPSFLSMVVVVLQTLLLECLHLFLILMTPLLVLFLRNVVRSWSFWYRGLATAWADKLRVTKEYVDAYRQGQLVRGWEYGILRFLYARLSKRIGLLSSIREAISGKSHLDQAGRLAEACRQTGTRVLIVHGADDALVPVSNSRRLADLLPNARYVEFKNCGHMPQEECPERFVECVADFILNP